jgi:hypothetical protein
LGSLLVDRGDYLQAEPLLRDAAVMMRDRMPEGHWRTALAESELGACLVGLQRYAEAEPLLVLGYEGVKAKLGKLDHRTARTVEHLDSSTRRGRDTRRRPVTARSSTG